jgi:tetratricopeptide (TPR) repeat protein
MKITKMRVAATITAMASASWLMSATIANADSVSSSCAYNCGPWPAPAPQRVYVPPPPTPEQAAAAAAQAAQQQRLATAQAQFEQGQKFFNAGDYDNAFQYWAAALANNPDSSNYRANLAVARAGQALTFYNHGDYANAIVYYQYAVNIDPSNPQHAQDLAIAQNRLQEVQAQAQAQELQRQAEVKQKQDNEVAVNNMQQIISGLAQSLDAPASQSSASTGSAPSTGGTTNLNFGDPTKSKGSGLTFGMPSNPNRSDTGIDYSKQPQKEKITAETSLEQLSSIAKSGDKASNKQNGIETAKDLSNCAFGTGGLCDQPGSVSYPKIGGQTPGAAQLAKYIPPAGQDDKQIQQSMAFYEKLDSEKIETQTKLAEIQKKIDSHTGDKKVLIAEKGTLNNDLKRTETDQANTQTQIKERLRDIHITWNGPTTGPDQANTKPQIKGPQPTPGPVASQ